MISLRLLLVLNERPRPDTGQQVKSVFSVHQFDVTPILICVTTKFPAYILVLFIADMTIWSEESLCGQPSSWFVSMTTELERKTLQN